MGIILRYLNLMQLDATLDSSEFPRQVQKSKSIEWIYGDRMPTKPKNVTLWPAVYAMEVSWSIPDPANGVILKYMIAYWRTDDASTRREKEMTENLRDVNTHVISNLTFRVLYSVQVKAFTSKGPGSYSDAVSAETVETVPRIPSDLAVRDVTDTSMKLSWSPPYPFSGAIIHYGVSYEATRSVFKDTLMKSVTLLLEGTDNSLPMEDLSPATLYKIGVNASTAKGFGDRAAALIWTKFSIDILEVLPRKEANTTFVAKSDSSVEVTLLHPHKDLKISEDTHIDIIPQ
ncbi:fibronectin type III domain-containing protein-like [Ptychodera flava]|uniref:fibronectin type III domain-containing protein-like n=1 Tax=Ptychodera flava TaxID=63121 RepID=UPI00396A9616